MSDKDLRSRVVEELDWEPSVDAADIGVTANDGVVTLSGHVRTYVQKMTAERAAWRVKGVKAIVQQIEVRLSAPNDDEAIARRAVNLLDWDASVPPGKVRVSVAKGLIALSGEVDWEYERRAAENAVRKLAGIVGVSNDITLKARVQPADVRARIEDALERYADLEAKGVRVDVADGRVTLSGKVRSWGERDVLERAAWAAPGVRMVEDRVTIGA